jgi:N-acylneuraminate-9-phosphatase
MRRDDAQACTTSFLSAFRLCPDKETVPLDDWRSSLWEEALPASHKPLKNEIYTIWLNLRYKYVTLSPAICEMLVTLRQKYLLAVITNGPTAAQWEKVQKIDVNKYFDCVLVSGDMPWEKPDPNIFYAACNYLGVGHHECLMIGDKLDTDIQVRQKFSI